MKKVVLASLVLAIAAFSLGSVSFAKADYDTPVAAAGSVQFGFGGHGGMGGRNSSGTQTGILHDEMMKVFSEELGISVEDLEARLANGETLSDIALAQGLTLDEFNTLMVDARNQAIDKAVADGLLTQTQADWMKSRSSMMGTGLGTTRGMGGMRGYNGTGTCLNLQTNQ